MLTFLTKVAVSLAVLKDDTRIMYHQVKEEVKVKAIEAKADYLNQIEVERQEFKNKVNELKNIPAYAGMFSSCKTEMEVRVVVCRIERIMENIKKEIKLEEDKEWWK